MITIPAGRYKIFRLRSVLWQSLKADYMFFLYLSILHNCMNDISIRLALLFSLVHGILLAQENTDDKGFHLVKEKDNIKIFERWIYFPKTDPPVEAREVKGVFFANTTIGQALALVKDETKIKRWQSHVEKFKVYPETDSLWYEYSYHDIPWPVSDQDHFLEYRIEEEIPGAKLFLTFTS